MQEIIMLDCEASSLSKNSYPISIGWASTSGDEDYFLIQPDQSWLDWSGESEIIHNLTRETLVKDGIPTQDACLRLNRYLLNCTIYTDAEQDKIWIEKLFRDSKVECHFDVKGLQEIENLCSVDLLKIHQAMEINKPHHALNDAKQLLNSYLSTQTKR